MIDEEQPQVFLEALKNYNLVTEEEVSQALREQSVTGESLRSIIVKLTGITDLDILYALAYHFGMETVSLADATLPSEITDLIPPDLATKYRVVPIMREGNTLRAATDNPLNFIGLDELRAILGLDIHGILASPTDIDAALEKYYGGGLDVVDIAEGLEDALTAITSDIDEEGEEMGAEDAPIIKAVDMLITQAIRERASDIHIEPRERRFIIRYRIDGVLHDRHPLPKRLQGPIIARLKLMANCDLSERRIPQDGRIKIRMPGGAGGKRREIDLRFSALPSLYGESLVMRILDKSGIMLGLEQVGFLPETIEMFEKLIAKPNGVILVTGPTGSGKTTTLYASLNKLNTPDRKLITIEDPVEYQLDGINQVQVRHEIGLDFAKGLRSVLRQAPDVILVGEIRDLETAEIAIRAALTGHLVFSTLHTNDAPGAVTRLVDMGINPFLVASSVEAIMAQRLVRRICEECKEPMTPDDALLRDFGLTREDIENDEFYHGTGCAACNMTGYTGRTTIFELLIMDEEIKELILANASSTEIRALARRKGMDTLREYGVKKIKLGMTTFLEVQRVTPSELTTQSQR